MTQGVFCLQGLLNARFAAAGLHSASSEHTIDHLRNLFEGDEGNLQVLVDADANPGPPVPKPTAGRTGCVRTGTPNLRG
jgi:hypothetical protein